MAGSQVAWGLDVGTTSLKAIKLRRDGDRVAVEAFDVIEHDKFLSEPDIDKDEVIRRTLQKFLERNPLKRDLVFVGVPGSQTFARFVKLPPVEPNKIPEIVRFEAIQQIPFPLDQVNWDYQTFQAPDSPDVEVGIFAMKKELVTQVMANFQANQMTVHGVQMSPLANYNAVIYDGLTEEKGTVILDIGAEHTDLIVADQGRLWIRTINIGGNNFTDALAKSFKQPFARAEQLKKSAATSKYAKQIFQAMRPVFADLVAEIQRSIGHYNSSHRDSRLERILGMGNPFKLPNLQKYLQQELKLDVVRLEGFKRANTDGRLAAGLAENILSLSTAYGLALQGLDEATIDTSLLPVEIARQMVWGQKRMWFAASAAALLIGVGGLTWRTWADNATWSDLESKQNTNNSAITRGTKLNQEYRSQNVSFESDRAEVTSYVNLAQHRKLWPELLVDIYSSLPQANAAKLRAEPTRLIAIESISTAYLGSGLAAATSGAAAAAGAPVAAPPMEGEGGEVAAPVTVAAAAPGSSDKGFIVVIKGYTPYSSGRNLVREYHQTLDARAPESKKDKPYYFQIANTPYRGDIFRPGVVGPSGTASVPKGPWGAAQRGPYWSVFVPDMQGIVPPAAPAVGGALDVYRPEVQELPVDAMFPKPAAPSAQHLMYGAYQFELTFKVHVR